MFTKNYHYRRKYGQHIACLAYPTVKDIVKYCQVEKETDLEISILMRQESFGRRLKCYSYYETLLHTDKENHQQDLFSLFQHVLEYKFFYHGSVDLNNKHKERHIEITVEIKEKGEER